MVVISQAPDLSGLQLFHTTDPLLSNGPILVFYGPAQNAHAAASASARIQCHVFAAAGLQSYHKLIVSPGSSLYAAVNCLPRQEQGDEICRALAFSILKYFTELPEAAKSAWIQQSLTSATKPPAQLNLWSDSHAADLARRMTPLEEPATVIRQVQNALSAQSVSILDLDLVLPPGTLPSGSVCRQEAWEADDDSNRYGQFSTLVKSFGETAFLPTSKIRRAPSRPTALNRSPTFTRAQKDNMRREMLELVETEHRYVEKLSDLVNNVAVSFREKAQQKPFESSSPNESALEALFPTSLNSMLLVNTSFLESLRIVLEETEGAMAKESDSAVTELSNTRAFDTTGALQFANALLEWFPKFADCYTDYIGAHSQFAPFLKTFAADSQTTFARRVHETGEQRLMSMLIEPVQRLPRYSLYIDNIVKQLPVRHPALKPFLKAKDTISDICSNDGSSSSLSKLHRFKQLIPSWPATCSPQGRFNVAVDVMELVAPFDQTSPGNNCQEYLLLLFAGYIVFVKKLGNSPISARTFMAEIENSEILSQSKPAAEEMTDNGLLFSHWTTLGDVSLFETASDSVLKLVPCKPKTTSAIRTPDDGSIRQFLLKGAYEGRASRLNREAARSRVEGRFSEAERDGDKWEVRSIEPERHGLGLFTAVFEEGENQYTSSRGQPGSIRVIMKPTREEKSFKAGQSEVDIVASVSPRGEGFFSLEIEAVNEKGTRDLTTEADFLPILAKRLGNLLQMRNQVRNPALTVYLLQHHSGILRSLDLAANGQSHNNIDTQARRPASPVKLLSTLFGSKSFKDNGIVKEHKTATPSLGKIPNLQPQVRQNTFTSPVLPGKENAPKSMASLLGDDSQASTANPLTLLEQTLSCYLVSLQARKGNVIGGVVARRGMADEAAVNQLYNTLLGDPNNYERAAQASVDMLFSAFEKFLKVAWRDGLGPVVPSKMLTEMQTKMEILNPFDYDEFAESKLSELSPQNRRAFSGIVTLLADLLDGMRNDGDRGTLTAAFAEMVVCDGDPHSFIPFFDRLVEDHEVLSPDRPNSQGASSGFGSMASSMNRTAKTGSLSSKASSLSKRLGFGSLKRENSKMDSTKKALPPTPGSDKPGLSRAKSIDLTGQLAALRRPGSRDRPGGFGATEGSRPGTSHSIEQAESIISSKENSPTKRLAKKKRRSSLSDLTNLQTPSASPFWTASASKQVEGLFRPSPGNAMMQDSPLRTMSARQDSPTRKENIPPGLKPSAPVSPKKGIDKEVPALPKHAFDNAANGHGNFTASSSTSEAQIPRGVLSEGISSGNTPPPLNIASNKEKESRNNSPTKPSENSSPKKLRMQSPAKLRERLQSHQQAVEGASSTLQAELAKIGEEIAAMNAKPVPPAKDDVPAALSSPTKSNAPPPPMAFNLNTRLKALESKVAHLTTNLAERASSLESDFASSLQVTERRSKNLDAELQLARAENEALYTRLNDETMKVFEQVRAGDGVDELRRQLRESHAEAAKWRKEAARLKRENTMLKATAD